MQNLNLTIDDPKSGYKAVIDENGLNYTVLENKSFAQILEPGFHIQISGDVYSAEIIESIPGNKPDYLYGQLLGQALVQPAISARYNIAANMLAISATNAGLTRVADLCGILDASSDAYINFQNYIMFGGIAYGFGTIDADIHKSIYLSAGAECVSGEVSELTKAYSLTALSNAQALISAQINREVYFTGSLNGVADIIAAMENIAEFSSAINAYAAITAELIKIIDITSTILSSASITSSLTKTQFMAVTAVATGVTDALITKAMFMASSVGGNAYETTSLSKAEFFAVTVTVSASSSVNAALTQTSTGSAAFSSAFSSAFN